MRRKAQEIVPDYHGVLFDETRDYNIAPGDRRWIESINTLYAFDANEQTYLAELTPSFFLVPVWTTVWTVPNVPDDVRDELDETYAHEGNEPTYMPVRDVEQYIKRNPDRHVVYGAPEEPEEGIDEVVEAWSANWPLGGELRGSHASRRLGGSSPGQQSARRAIIESQARNKIETIEWSKGATTYLRSRADGSIESGTAIEFEYWGHDRDGTWRVHVRNPRWEQDEYYWKGR